MRLMSNRLENIETQKKTPMITNPFSYLLWFDRHGSSLHRLPCAMLPCWVSALPCSGDCNLRRFPGRSCFEGLFEWIHTMFGHEVRDLDSDSIHHYPNASEWSVTRKHHSPNYPNIWSKHRHANIFGGWPLHRLMPWATTRMIGLLQIWGPGRKIRKLFPGCLPEGSGWKLQRLRKLLHQLTLDTLQISSGANVVATLDVLKFFLRMSLTWLPGRKFGNTWHPWPSLRRMNMSGPQIVFIVPCFPESCLCKFVVSDGAYPSQPAFVNCSRLRSSTSWKLKTENLAEVQGTSVFWGTQCATEPSWSSLGLASLDSRLWTQLPERMKIFVHTMAVTLFGEKECHHRNGKRSMVSSCNFTMKRPSTFQTAWILTRDLDTQGRRQTPHIWIEQGWSIFPMAL